MYVYITRERNQIIKSSRKGIFGRIISWLFLLAIGGLLGAAAMYYYLGMKPVEVIQPQVLQPVTNTTINLNANTNVNSNTKSNIKPN